jgi:hypothetical protein
MSGNPFMQSLGDIFANVNLFDFYTRYQGFIDFGIYLYLFTSLTWIIYPKFFGDKRPSRTLSQAVAVFLAIGAMVAEKYGNFTIATFWPLAVLVFLLVVCMFAYHLLMVLKIESFTAISIVFLVMYLSIISWQPSVWNWLQKFPLIASGITLLALFSGIVVFSKSVPPFIKNFGHITREGGLDPTFITRAGVSKFREEISDLKSHHQTQFKQEDMILTNRMHKISAEATKNSERIKEHFLTVHNLCQNHRKQLAEDDNLRKNLFDVVQRILPTEQHALWNKIALLGHDLKKIYNFELREMHELSDKYKELKGAISGTKISDEDLKTVRRIIHEEFKKHMFENRFAHLESELKSHYEKLQQITNHLLAAVENADLEKALHLAEEGAAEAEHGQHLEEKTIHIERKLDVFTKRIEHELGKLKEVPIKQ